ncbi:PANX3 [Branchiostoma lanceolatum]|uniref:PANX3 protein n=1 Tax=Branchiostoma lanceolatum TaxID=7740 RepID=A0A8J9YMV2_BRALA|nr:PANX3 [Branchiostoma lanceolatum]
MAATMVEKIMPDVTGEDRHGQVTLDTWFDRLMKALTVWLPLLVSGSLFLGEITGEPQSVFCYPPSNFSIPQANYLNAFCEPTLLPVTDWILGPRTDESEAQTSLSSSGSSSRTTSVQIEDKPSKSASGKKYTNV